MNQRRQRPILLLALSRAAADRMVSILRRANVPAYVEADPIHSADGTELHAVGVPPANYLKSRAILVERAPDLAVRGKLCDEPIFDMVPPEGHGAPDSLFRELGAEGVTDDRIRSSLAEFYLRADAHGRERAIEAIGLLAEGGDAVVAGLLPIVCRRPSDEERLWQLAGYFAARHSPAPMDSLGPLLRDPSPAVRSRALMALGKIGDPGALAEIVRLYADPSPDVQAEAADAVWRITGEDDGFDPDLPPTEKARIVEEWSRRI